MFEFLFLLLIVCLLVGAGLVVLFKFGVLRPSFPGQQLVQAGQTVVAGVGSIFQPAPQQHVAPLQPYYPPPPQVQAPAPPAAGPVNGTLAEIQSLLTNPVIGAGAEAEFREHVQQFRSRVAPSSKADPPASVTA